MNDHSVLGQLALGYSPMIDRQRAVVATRLTVFPERPDAAIDAAALLRALAEVWPEVAAGAGDQQPLRLTTPRPIDTEAARAAAAPHAVVLLNLAGENLLAAALDSAPGPAVMVEVPAFVVGDPAQAGRLRGAHASGTALLIKGRPLSPLPPELLALFGHTMVDAGDDVRAPAAAPASPELRRLLSVQSGVDTSAGFAAAFERGAAAVVGWPLGDPQPVARPGSGVPTDVRVVMELIDGVDRELPVPRLEAVLKRDPTLAFRLLRYLNSPAFGLRVEVNSFGHALMLLGYQRLKRWLALLLATSARGTNAKPLVHAALRRGLLMEELARDQTDADSGGEMFICGVFSLLDRLLQQPLADLLAGMPVPDRVQQALRGDGGPYLPYLELVQAIEQCALYDMREHAETLLLAPAVVNRALLRALRTARQFDA